MPDREAVVVIGAGAAGIVAAWRAASLGAAVTLLEKNDRIGTKILISGGGKCNITHDGPVEDLLRAFRPGEARFLRPACYRFASRDIVGMLTRRGLEVYTRPDRRIFPVHGTAKDVVAVLQSYLEAAGVRLKLRATVTDIEADAGGVRGVRLGGGFIPARHVVLATGGCSYPGTGATGDGWPWARALGHTVVKVRAALAPIFLDPMPPAAWAGVALRDAILRARQDGREFARQRGDILFTHRGLSGPATLEISREVAESREQGPVALEADLRPDTPFEALAAELRAWAREHPRRHVVDFVESLAPHRLAPALLEAAQVPPDTGGAYLSRKAQNRLVATIKGWPLGTVQQVPLEKGEVAAGGVALDEVDSRTMRSVRARGLYLCGEVLDIAGPVGGYNLQAAFSTGYVAGETAARDTAQAGDAIGEETGG